MSAVALGALLTSSATQAAKEKFERTKPHVNVGTIGRSHSEAALLYLRLNLPAQRDRSQPACQFHGVLEVRELITTSDGTSTAGHHLATLELRDRRRVELSDPSTVHVVELPFDSGSGAAREILQIELIADSATAKDACALDALLDVHDSTTGDSRQQRHTPFFQGYRPQFYLRTSDVTE